MDDRRQSPDELDLLFQAYRSSCPDPESGAAFMPKLWAQIEGRRRATRLYGLFARRVLAGAAALSIVMAVLVMKPFQAPKTMLTNNTYLEALADDRQEGLIELEATPGERR